ncbi:MAG: hypothetical protein ACI4TX_03070 [Christensenellales bacterium]
MLKYWLRNRFIFSLLTILVLGLISIFVFYVPYLANESENLIMSSVYEKSKIDFDIPSPTKTQLSEIKNLDFIDDVFGYYYTESLVNIGNKTKKTKILFSDMMDSIEFTMYNQSRLIFSKEGLQNPIYIDYEFSKVNNVHLGDEIVFNNIKFQVGRIYETNTYYISALFAPLVGEQKELIESISKSYSGAYLKCNDILLADSFLKTYKPEGRLKDRSEFATDDEYQFHYNSWNNASYYNEITSFASKLDAIVEKTSVHYLFGYGIALVVMVALFILLSLRKCEKNYFSKKKCKQDVFSYYGISLVADSWVLFIVTTICSLIATLLVNNYLSPVIVTEMLIVGIICSVMIFVFEGLYSLSFQKKINK